MICNGSDKIKSDGNDYLVLTDYGTEGFAIVHQAATPEDAFDWMVKNNTGCPMTLVKLVRMEFVL